MLIELLTETQAKAMSDERSPGPSTGQGAIALGLERLQQAVVQLVRHCPLLPVMAIQWTCLKHPFIPAQVGQLSREFGSPSFPCQSRSTRRLGRVASSLKTVGKIFVRGVACVGYAFYLSGLLVWVRWLFRREWADLKRQSFELIAKTWGWSDRVTNEDFYYANLQDRLVRRGLHVLRLYGDGNGLWLNPWRWWVFAKTQRQGQTLPMMPEWCLVPPWVPSAFAWRQLSAAWQVHRLAVRTRDPFLKRVSQAARIDCMAKQTTENGLYFWIAQTAVSTWRPQAFMALYEGHAWERCAWWGAKTAEASCQTIGYQHTILIRHNLALLAGVDQEPAHFRPDIVLCLGPQTQALLQEAHPATRLLAFGSCRQGATGIEEATRTPQPDRRTLLVVPEGRLLEYQLLFEVAMAVARLLPDHRVIFRCHPALPFARVRPLLCEPPERYPNVELSPHESLEPDLARSSAVFYRGSAAVLLAVVHGLKPIYLQHEHDPDTDPLFELARWREGASSAAAVAERLRRYAAMTQPAATEQWREAAAYVHRYLQPVTEQSIDQWLTATGLTGRTLQAEGARR